MSDDDNVRANALVVKEGGNMRRERKGVEMASLAKARMVRTAGPLVESAKAAP